MRHAIDVFFGSHAYAVVGVSRNAKKFGNSAFREMQKHGYTVYPVNPHLETVEGTTCYPDVRALPPEVKSVVVVVHPEDVTPVLSACEEHGIENVWLQQGSESDEAIAFARSHGLNVVHGQCILMFVEPVRSFHAFHRWVNKLTGAYPS